MEARQDYHPLITSEFRESEDAISNGEDIRFRHHQISPWKRWIPSSILGTLLTLCFLVFGLIVTVLVRQPIDQQSARQLSMWSPALDAVEYVTVDFDDAFNSTSIYRGLPTPEREEAWFNLTYKHGVEIPEDTINGLNRTEEDHLKHVPTKVGTGYTALLEVFHQLHCLNMVRMYTWHLAGKYPGIPMGLSDSALKNRIHVDHCLEALRIALMCWGVMSRHFLFGRVDRPAPVLTSTVTTSAGISASLRSGLMKIGV